MRVLFLLSLATLVAGCDLFDANGGGDWQIADPTDLTYEPAEYFQLDIQGVDVEWKDLRVWIDDQPWQLQATAVVGQGDPATTSDDRIRVSDYMFTAQLGKHTLAVGDVNGPRTKVFDIDVVVPPPALSADETAALLRDGARAITSTVRDILADPDPEVSAALEHAMGPNKQQAIELLQATAVLGDDMAEKYLALSPDNQALVQTMLKNVGILDAFTEIARGPVSNKPHGEVVTVFDRLTHKTARAMFMLDLGSSALDTLGDAVMIVNVIAFFGGPLALAWEPIGAEAELVIGIVKAIIDSVVPTDLVALDPQTQAKLFPHEGAQWVYWGTFQPENGVGGTIIAIADAAISYALDKFHFGETGFKPRIQKIFEDVLSNIASRYPDLFAKANLSFDNGRASRVKLLVNMQAYGLTISDLALLVPMFGACLKVSGFFLDYEAVSPYTLIPIGDAPEAEIEIDYATDAFGIDGILFAEGAEGVNYHVKASAFGWQNINTLFLSIPWPEWVEREVPTRVVPRPITSNPNDNYAYETYLLTHGQPGPVTTEDAVWESEPKTRAARISFLDELDYYEGQSAMRVTINDVDAFPRFDLPEGINVTPQFSLQPGKNTITITALQGHHDAPREIARPLTYHFQTLMTLPEAKNHETRRRIYLEEGQSITFDVFVPPAFD